MGVYFYKDKHNLDKNGNIKICLGCNPFEYCKGYYCRCWDIVDTDDLTDLSKEYLFSLAEEFVKKKAYLDENNFVANNLGFSKWRIL